MPDRSKAERIGYVVEVEGGEEGAQSVYIPAKGPKVASGNVPAPSASRSVPASSSPERAAPEPGAGPGPASGKAVRPSFWSRVGAWFGSSREETPDMDHALNKVSRKEADFSERRFERKKNDALDTRFERRDAVMFDLWEGRSEDYGLRRNESVDMTARFEGERVDKPRVTYDRMDFDDFERRSDKAEIRNWNERRARDVSDRFGDPAKRMSFRERMATGYSLMSRVSMQDINRYQYRRNRSDEKGALPVAKPGVEARAADAD